MDGALVGDFFLRVDERDSLGLLKSGAYEPYETALLCHLAAPGSTVVDVGANIGYYTLHFARAVGPAGQVVAFEPDPDNLRLLEHNVRTNRLHNVTIVPKAAAAATGVGRLFLSEDNTGDHRLYESGERRRSVEVATTTVDDALGDWTGPVSLIKLDIQGFEPHALTGMRRLLEGHPEAWIATECWPAGLLRAGSSADAYLDALRALRPSILRIDERRRRVAPLDVAWLRQTVTVERGNHTNLLAVPTCLSRVRASVVRTVR